MNTPQFSDGARRMCVQKQAPGCPRFMAQRIPKIPINELASHALIGAGLGAFLALTTMISNPNLLDLIANNQYPRLAVLGFVGVLSWAIAVGSNHHGFYLQRCREKPTRVPMTLRSFFSAQRRREFVSHLTDLPLVTVQGLRGAQIARARKTARDVEENEMTAFRIGLERVIYDHTAEPVGIGFTVYDANTPIIGLAFGNSDDARQGVELVQQLFALVTSITPLRY